MFNVHLTPVDIVVSIVNILFIVRALYWNYKAALTGILENIRRTVIFFCVVYVGAYLWLMFTDIKIETWGTIFRGVGILVFWSIWGNPAKEGIRVQKGLVGKLSEEVTKQLKEQS